MIQVKVLKLIPVHILVQELVRLLISYLIYIESFLLTGPVYLDNVRCVGNEESITECSFVGFGHLNNICLHTQDAGVQCNGSKSKFNTLFKLFSVQVYFSLITNTLLIFKFYL